MFIAELVPQRMEFAVVRPVDNVAEFVEHGVGDLFDGEELGSVARVAEAEHDLLASVHIQAWSQGSQ